MHERYKQLFGKQFCIKRSWDLFSYLAKDIAKDLTILLKKEDSIPDELRKDLQFMKWGFSQIACDYPDSPFNIAWNKYWNEYGRHRKPEDWIEEKDGSFYHKSDERFVSPDKEIEKAYYDKINDCLDLLAKDFIVLCQYKNFKQYPKKIANDLRAFKKYNINSVPACLVPNIDDYRNGSQECEDLTDERMVVWHDIVEKMYQSFDKISCNDYNDVQEGLELFSKYFCDLWD